MFIKTPGGPLLADQMSDPGKRELVRFQKVPHWGFVPGKERRRSGTVLPPGQAPPNSEREWRGPVRWAFKMFALDQGRIIMGLGRFAYTNGPSCMFTYSKQSHFLGRDPCERWFLKMFIFCHKGTHTYAT